MKESGDVYIITEMLITEVKNMAQKTRVETLDESNIDKYYWIKMYIEYGGDMDDMM
jgi:hypothetical protein